MPLSTFAGGHLVGVRHGTERPRFLALHGWRRDHHDFDQILEGLDAIALDLPGFGAAAAPAEAWTTADYAAAIVPLLDEMEPNPVILGHSFGGRVAVRMGELVPSRLGGLVLTGVPLVRAAGAPVRRPPRAVRLGRALHRFHLLGDDRMEALRQRYGSADYRAATGTLRTVLVKAVGEDGRYGDSLAAFPGPVALVWGEVDTAAPLSGARLALERCRQGQLAVLPGIDHFTPQRAPEALRTALLRLRDRS